MVLQLNKNFVVHCFVCHVICQLNKKCVDLSLTILATDVLNV